MCCTSILECVMLVAEADAKWTTGRPNPDVPNNDDCVAISVRKIN